MTKERIPGEHDLTTAAPTQPGVLGTTGYGGDLPPTGIDLSMNEQQRRQSRWEGGGRTPRATRDENRSTDEETSVGHKTEPFDERNEPDERPGNRPAEQQERSADDVERTRPGKRAISGPGAADFLAATGGEDLPGFSPNKGMAATRGESDITDPKNLVPRLGPDTEAHPGERKPDEEMPGSATGTIGGGGPEVHKKTGA